VRLFGVPPPFRQVQRLLIGTRKIQCPLLVDKDSLGLPTDTLRMFDFVQISNRLCCPIPSSILDMWNSCSSQNLYEIICKGILPLSVFLVINDNPYGLMFLLSFL
jgi:hypothetical protein